MDKQIEELEKDIAVRMAMAKGIAGSMNNGVEGWLANYLIDLGYCKITKNSVVLTRGEYQKYLAYKIIEPQIRGCLDRERELEKRLETIAKETAERFAERVKGRKIEMGTDGYSYCMVFVDDIDEICKEFIKGDKV